MSITKCFLITGTGTEVGRTVASSVLLRAANQSGFNTVGYKPVASGSDLTTQGLHNEDALALQRNSQVVLSCEQVDPYTLVEPASPHIISTDEGQPIVTTTLSSGLHGLGRLADWVLMEGTGGWFTSLSDTLTSADQAQQEQLPIILVVGVKFGCINHVALTAQAMRQAGLPLAGWITNDVQSSDECHGECLTTLKNRLAAPFLGEMPWLVGTAQHDDLGQYLDLSALDLVSSTAPVAVHPAPQYRPRRHYAPSKGHRTGPPPGG